MSDHLASDLYNRAWDLLDSPDRTAAEDDELLAMAFASRWHWGQADGAGDEQFAIGDWFIGHVAAHLGLPDVALRFSGRALARVTEMGRGGWLLASAYEGMARASAVNGDAEGRDEFSASAERALEDVDDPDERAVIADQLATVPPV
jgi:hypothetical protein